MYWAQDSNPLSLIHWDLGTRLWVIIYHWALKISAENWCKLVVFGALVGGRRMLSLFQYHTPCQRAACYRTGNVAAWATRLWSHHPDRSLFAEGVQMQLRGGKSAAGLQNRATGLSGPAQRVFLGGWSHNGAGWPKLAGVP